MMNLGYPEQLLDNQRLQFLCACCSLAIILEYFITWKIGQQLPRYEEKVTGWSQSLGFVIENFVPHPPPLATTVLACYGWLVFLYWIEKRWCWNLTLKNKGCLNDGKDPHFNTLFRSICKTRANEILDHLQLLKSDGEWSSSEPGAWFITHGHFHDMFQVIITLAFVVENFLRISSIIGNLIHPWKVGVTFCLG